MAIYDGGVDKSYSFGAPGWSPIVGDWNATGNSYIGVTNGQQWYLDWNGNGVWDVADKAYNFGAPGWSPETGDWNNDGKTDIGVTNGQQWYLDWNNNGVYDGGVDKSYSFGAPGGHPLLATGMRRVILISVSRTVSNGILTGTETESGTVQTRPIHSEHRMVSCIRKVDLNKN